MDAGAGAAGAGADAGAGVDTTTTGSIGTENYGSLISSLQSDASVDLAAFNESSTVNCVAVSSLQGNAAGNAEALDNALMENQDKLTSLHSSIQANADLMTELESSCTTAQIEDLNVEDVVAVKSDTAGEFTFFIDDRA